MTAYLYGIAKDYGVCFACRDNGGNGIEANAMTGSGVDLNARIGAELLTRLGEAKYLEVSAQSLQGQYGDGNAMLALLAAMRELGWVLSDAHQDAEEPYSFMAAFVDPRGTPLLGPDFWSTALTLPEAVAKAAALALGIVGE